MDLFVRKRENILQKSNGKTSYFYFSKFHFADLNFYVFPIWITKCFVSKICGFNLQFLGYSRDYVVNEMHGKQANLAYWTGGQAKWAVHVSYQIFPKPPIL